jgi:hypothetical protein
MRHKKSKHIHKTVKVRQAEYWEGLLKELPAKGAKNNKLVIPESWKYINELFEGLEAHLNMAKMRKSGVANSVTLPMISDMF